LLIVGLAPGMHGANATGRPFTGDHAGVLLYQTLYKFGFSSAPVSAGARDGLMLTGCLITNAVRCLPPQNKPTPEEMRSCNRYLRHELLALPRPAVVLALGTVAHAAVLRGLDAAPAAFAFGHGRWHAPAPGIVLVDSYHCSRYNTQTRRLTPAMFHEVFRAIRIRLDDSDGLRIR
jgi:uracil-DNA glycosylase family 4